MVKVGIYQRKERAPAKMATNHSGEALAKGLTHLAGKAGDMYESTEKSRISKESLNAEANIITGRDALNDELAASPGKEEDVKRYQEGNVKLIKDNMAPIRDSITIPHLKEEFDNGISRMVNTQMAESLTQENSILATKSAMKTQYSLDVSTNSAMKKISNISLDSSWESQKAVIENSLMKPEQKMKAKQKQKNSLYYQSGLYRLKTGNTGKVKQDLDSGFYDTRISPEQKLQLIRAVDTNAGVSSHIYGNSLGNVETSYVNGVTPNDEDISIVRQGLENGLFKSRKDILKAEVLSENFMLFNKASDWSVADFNKYFSKAPNTEKGQIRRNLFEKYKTKTAELAKSNPQALADIIGKPVEKLQSMQSEELISHIDSLIEDESSKNVVDKMTEYFGEEGGMTLTPKEKEKDRVMRNIYTSLKNTSMTDPIALAIKNTNEDFYADPDLMIDANGDANLDYIGSVAVKQKMLKQHVDENSAESGFPAGPNVLLVENAQRIGLKLEGISNDNKKAFTVMATYEGLKDAAGQDFAVQWLEDVDNQVDNKESYVVLARSGNATTASAVMSGAQLIKSGITLPPDSKEKINDALNDYVGGNIENKDVLASSTKEISKMKPMLERLLVSRLNNKQIDNIDEKTIGDAIHAINGTVSISEGGMLFGRSVLDKNKPSKTIVSKEQLSGMLTNTGIAGTALGVVGVSSSVPTKEEIEYSIFEDQFEQISVPNDVDGETVVELLKDYKNHLYVTDKYGRNSEYEGSDRRATYDSGSGRVVEIPEDEIVFRNVPGSKASYIGYWNNGVELKPAFIGGTKEPYIVDIRKPLGGK